MKKGREMKHGFGILTSLLLVGLFTGTARGQGGVEVPVGEAIELLSGLRVISWKPVCAGSRRPKEKPDLTVLSKLGPRAVPLVGFATGCFPKKSDVCVAILKKIGPDAIEPMRKLLSNRNTNPIIRRGLVSIASSLGSSAKPLAPALLDMLSDAEADMKFRYQIASALFKTGVSARDLVPVVRRISKEPSTSEVQRLKSSLISLFAYADKPDEQTVTFLLESTKDASFRYRAVKTLGAIGKDPKHVMPVLLAMLSSNDTGNGMRCVVLEAIGAFGPSAKAFYADVLKLSQAAPNAHQKHYYIQTAARIGSKDDVAKLLKGVIKEDGQYVLSAWTEYIKRFPNDRKALDGLARAAVKPGSPAQFDAAVSVLGTLAATDGAPAGEVLLGLLDKIKEKLSGGRCVNRYSEGLVRAVVSSGRLSPEHIKPLMWHASRLSRTYRYSELVAMIRSLGLKAVPPLLEALDDFGGSSRRIIENSLVNLGVEATIPLAKAFASGDQDYRHKISQVMARYWTSSPKIVPHIRKGLTGKRPFVSLGAMRMLKLLGPKGAGAAKDVWALRAQPNRFYAQAVLGTYLDIAPDGEKRLTKLILAEDSGLTREIAFLALGESITFRAKMWNACCTAKSTHIRRKAFIHLASALEHMLNPHKFERFFMSPIYPIEQRKMIAEAVLKLVKKGLTDDEISVRQSALACVVGLSCQYPKWANQTLWTAIRSDKAPYLPGCHPAFLLAKAQHILNPSVEDMIKAILDTENRSTKRYLATMVYNAKPAGVDAIPMLVKVLKDHDVKADKYTVEAAATALAAMGPAAVSAVKPVAKMLREDISQWNQTKVLLKLGPVGESALVDIYIENDLPAKSFYQITSVRPFRRLMEKIEAKAKSAKSTSEATRWRRWAKKISGNEKQIKEKEALQAFARKHYADLLKPRGSGKTE
ncbi:MAG: hypothetical protein GY794_09525 [bacterium]|nr:hypothetical protein [bacterium]